MSFITRAAPRALHAARFSTSVRAQKSAAETIKEAAKVVDKTVSGAAVSGIEAAGTPSTP